MKELTIEVRPSTGMASFKTAKLSMTLHDRSRLNDVADFIKKSFIFQFLFANGDMLTFMDMETYDQIELAAEFVGDQAAFLQDGMKTLVQMYDAKPIGIKLPVQVTLTVAEADPVLKGGTAAPSYKSAVLENGLKIQVPPFIEAGEKIVVATEDGSYVERAKD